MQANDYLFIPNNQFKQCQINDRSGVGMNGYKQGNK